MAQARKVIVELKGPSTHEIERVAILRACELLFRTYEAVPWLFYQDMLTKQSSRGN